MTLKTHHPHTSNNKQTNKQTNNDALITHKLFLKTPQTPFQFWLITTKLSHHKYAKKKKPVILNSRLKIGFPHYTVCVNQLSLTTIT